MAAAIRGLKDAGMFRAVDMSGNGNGPFIMGADNEPEIACFSLSVYGLTPPASPTDFLTIYNASSSKLIRLKSFLVSGQATAAMNVQLSLIRRTANDTGGTFVPITPGAHDTGDGASIATVGYYSANPSGLGTGGVTLHTARVNLAPAASSAIDRTTQWQWTWQNDKAICIRPGQLLALNLNGVTLANSGVLDIDALWSEE